MEHESSSQGTRNTFENKDIIKELAERLSLVSAAIVGLVYAYNQLLPAHKFLAKWVVWMAILYITTYLFNRSVSRLGRILRPLAFGILVLAALVLGVLQTRETIAVEKQRDLLADFERKLRGPALWVAYEPAGYDPYAVPRTYGTLEQIGTELETLRSAGVTGIITFSSEAILAEIPRLSKRIGFRGVVMGIYDVSSKSELQAAFAARDFVDAYCVGHMFTDTNALSEQEILDAIGWLRDRTRKPLSTTLRPSGYSAFRALADAADWFFPDVHGNWYNNASGGDVLTQTKAFVSELAQLQREFPEKPILLKMISLPSEGVPGATTREQYQFFRSVVEYTKSDVGFPERIYPSYFSAYDLSWKKPSKKWPAGERHTGFFEANLMPKMACVEGKKVRVIDALKWSRTSTPTEEPTAVTVQANQQADDC